MNIKCCNRREDAAVNIKILVSTHKPYVMPSDQDLYLPIQVGCDETTERFGIQGDNTGDNISFKHRYYSDLSAVYWAWKNLDADVIGSCHYRRYFVSRKIKKENEPPFRYILSKKEVEDLIAKCPVIVAKKRHYYIETMESHYAHSHNEKDFQLTREIISQQFPAYLPAFNHVAAETSAHIFNTFIMRQDYLDQFCSFLFPVLFELEKRVDFTGYNEYESRVCGYMAEFLLDVWIVTENIPFQEVRLAMIEKQNWPLKIWRFLVKKFYRKGRAFPTVR